jgi:hypothetical protein
MRILVKSKKSEKRNEAKVTEKYQGFTNDWRITSVSESKIDEVIE